MTDETQKHENKTKTYKDFPDFYNNDFIKSIAKNEKWTVSDKNKRPIDMHALIERNVIWGVAYDRGYNPLVSLDALLKRIPNAANNAYYIEAETDHHVVLDIEPKCPDVLKKALCQLPYVYGELSMSGKGYHLVFELPEDLWYKYPNVQNKLAIKEQNGYYEILLNHMVTFTRNMIEPSDCTKNLSEFRNIFEKLANEAIKSYEKSELTDIKVTDMDTDDIPMYNRTMTVLRAQIYGKTLDDFKNKKDPMKNDPSRFEFGMAGFYYNALKRIMKTPPYEKIEYTDEQKALIVYNLISEKLEYREKHDTRRNGMPWLMYIATNCIAKTDRRDQDEAIKKELEKNNISNS